MKFPREIMMIILEWKTSQWWYERYEYFNCYSMVLQIGRSVQVFYDDGSVESLGNLAMRRVTPKKCEMELKSRNTFSYFLPRYKNRSLLKIQFMG